MHTAMNMMALVTDFLVLPATLDGNNVQISSAGSRPVAIIIERPHRVHNKPSLGNNPKVNMPTNDGIVEAIMRNTTAF